MGMYTEIFFRAEINQYAHTILNQIQHHGYNEDLRPDSHPFWGLDRAGMVFQGGSAYHEAARTGTVTWTESYGSTKAHSAIIHSSLKNYSGEIEEFFDWVAPHVEENGFIGYAIYEEYTQSPVIYRKTRDGLHIATDYSHEEEQP